MFDLKKKGMIKTMGEEKKEYQAIKIPHTYVIIFAFIIIAALATWLLPGGVYEKVKHAATGRMIVILHRLNILRRSIWGLWMS